MGLALRLPIILLAMSLPAQALFIRPDRKDAEYLELAERYPAALRLGTAGEAALIAPRWLVTTADVAKRIDRAKPLEAGGQRAAVQAVHIHPDGRLALVFLREALSSIEPAPIYRGDDEAGKAVIVVGHGESGTSPASPRRDGRKRAGINTVARVLGNLFALQVKSGDDASDLQGAAANDERGGAAFLEAGGAIRVAGLFSRTQDTNRDAVEGDAGDWQLYVRLSSHAAWIDDTMVRVALEEAAAIKRP